MLLNRLTDRYKRWRHGHGYGVHSPYAYHIVREVLRPSDQVGYYAYTDIHSLCRRYAAPCRWPRPCCSTAYLWSCIRPG